MEFLETGAHDPEEPVGQTADIAYDLWSLLGPDPRDNYRTGASPHAPMPERQGKSLEHAWKTASGVVLDEGAICVEGSVGL